MRRTWLCPWLISRLTYRRTDHDNSHVRGYRKEGTINRLPQAGDKGIYRKRQRKDKLIEHKQHNEKCGEDLPEIRNWKWSNHE
jgi:xylulose-5-phosphate/fructose-6-phosphate phosphoketolase